MTITRTIKITVITNNNKRYKMPALNMPALNMPALNMPALNMPALNMPALNMPALNMPALNMPALNILFVINDCAIHNCIKVYQVCQQVVVVVRRNYGVL